MIFIMELLGENWKIMLVTGGLTFIIGWLCRRPGANPWKIIAYVIVDLLNRMDNNNDHRDIIKKVKRMVAHNIPENVQKTLDAYLDSKGELGKHKGLAGTGKGNKGYVVRKGKSTLRGGK